MSRLCIAAQCLLHQDVYINYICFSAIFVNHSNVRKVFTHYGTHLEVTSRVDPNAATAHVGVALGMLCCKELFGSTAADQKQALSDQIR